MVQASRASKWLSPVTFLLMVIVASCRSAPDPSGQRRLQEAYDCLVLAEKANPTNWQVKRNLALTLGGWFEFSEAGKPIRAVGLDRPIEAYDKYYGDPKWSYRVWATRPEVKKYSLEWYRFLWESYWFAKRAGEKDAKYAGVAENHFRRARSTDNFAHLRAMGDEGEQIYRCFMANR